MFNFYDTKGDGLVDFEEFVIGVALTNSKTRTPEKLKRIFKGYDLNGDGYVERKDFLRMFKAFYTLSKVLVRDIVASLGDELYEQGHMDQALNGRQPISAVFTSSIPPARRSWDKPHSAEEQEGDEEDDSPVVLPSSLDHMGPEDLARVEKIRSCASTPEPGSEGEREKALEDTRRTEFWSFNTEDDDLDLPDEEKDVGSEVLYHMAVQGMNERLDMLFSAKEKAAVSVRFEDEGDDPSNKDDEGHIASNGSAEGSYREHATNGSEENGHDANGLPTNSAGISTGTTNHNPHHGILKKTSKKERDSRRKVLDEIKQRGGEGRLNYEEFEKIMTGKDASRLEFVGTWTDLASF
jgi:Ca2+-binding EF-hand superfamily protein